MMYNIEFSNFARKDFDKTIDYICNTLKNPYAGFQLGTLAEETISSLTLFPYKHQLVQDSYLLLYQIRYIKVKNYLIIYTVSEENKIVYIVRFLYTRSNWINILRKSIHYDEHFSKATGGYIHEGQEEFNKK